MSFIDQYMQRSQDIIGERTPEEQERMTEEYQKNIKNGPMWEKMVKKYGEEKAEEMLKEFQVQIK